MRAYLFAFLLVVLIAPALAQSDDLYKQNTEVDLKYFCQQENGVDCDSTAVCNITLLGPSEQVILDSSTMTNQGAYHNYTLNTSQTSLIGTHTVKLVCVDSPLIGYETFTIDLTPSGTTPDTAQGQLYISLFVAGILFFMLSLWGTIRIKWGNTRMEDGTIVDVNDLKYLKLFLGFMSYILLIFIAWTAWKIGDFFLWFDLGQGVFEGIFWILIVFLGPSIIIAGLTFFMALFKDKNTKKLLNRGLRPR